MQRLSYPAQKKRLGYFLFAARRFVPAASWRQLVSLYDGIVGKSVIVVSLAIPVSKLLSFGIHIPGFDLSLVGALLLLVGYLFYILACPVAVRRFPSREASAESRVTLFERKVWDVRFELGWLDSLCEEEKNATIARCGLPADFRQHLPVRDADKNLGSAKTAYYVSLLAYDYRNYSRLFLRISATWIFVVGAALIYNTAITASLKILGVQ